MKLIGDDNEGVQAGAQGTERSDSPQVDQQVVEKWAMVVRARRIITALTPEGTPDIPHWPQHATDAMVKEFGAEVRYVVPPPADIPDDDTIY